MIAEDSTSSMMLVDRSIGKLRLYELAMPSNCDPPDKICVDILFRGSHKGRRVLGFLVYTFVLLQNFGTTPTS
jgi:hypothetical protein